MPLLQRCTPPSSLVSSSQREGAYGRLPLPEPPAMPATPPAPPGLGTGEAMADPPMAMGSLAVGFTPEVAPPPPCSFTPSGSDASEPALPPQAAPAPMAPRISQRQLPSAARHSKR